MTNYISHISVEPHTLIAGTTGSGKTVLLNRFITEKLEFKPKNSLFRFIDLKRIELCKYKRVKQCRGYADTPEAALIMLRKAVDDMDYIYSVMQRKKVKPINQYIIIDELADLMTSQYKKEFVRLIQRICQLGRSANIHLVACTQCPLASIIPTSIKVNFTVIFGLRTRTAQDSRNILGYTGCESLPKYGQAYMSDPEGDFLINIEMMPEEHIQEVINANKKKWWQR